MDAGARCRIYHTEREGFKLSQCLTGGEIAKGPALSYLARLARTFTPPKKGGSPRKFPTFFNDFKISDCALLSRVFPARAGAGCPGRRNHGAARGGRQPDSGVPDVAARLPAGARQFRRPRRHASRGAAGLPRAELGDAAAGAHLHPANPRAARPDHRPQRQSAGADPRGLQPGDRTFPTAAEMSATREALAFAHEQIGTRARQCSMAARSPSHGRR